MFISIICEYQQSVFLHFIELYEIQSSSLTKELILFPLVNLFLKYVFWQHNLKTWLNECSSHSLFLGRATSISFYLLENYYEYILFETFAMNSYQLIFTY